MQRVNRVFGAEASQDRRKPNVIHADETGTFPTSSSSVLSDAENARAKSQTNHTDTTLARLAIANGISIDSSLVGNSEKIQIARELIKQFSLNDFPVLINGETGTGKELAAHDIHNNSERRNGKFISLNCAALPDTLAESILFGHEKGSFTDASGRTLGYFELASGGTIFLDEVAELSPIVQGQLLRVLDDGVITRVGGEKDIEVNVRIVTATNRDLRKLVLSNQFLEQLFYRLNICEIEMPPLREHIEDIDSLSLSLLKKHKSLAPNKDLIDLSQKAIEKLRSHPWSGNVRELENIIKRAIIFSYEPSTVSEKDIAISTEEVSKLVSDHFLDISISSLPILITGEVGSGKGHTADRIHFKSGRSGEFISVNCAGITPSLIDSYLFGHVKGAFTDAKTNHNGRFQLAKDGTLLLDEINKLPLSTQTKLLRALQENEIYKVGAETSERFNARIIASSSEDLNIAVKEGRFREDLLNRLNVIPVEIKPLRERKEEIPGLIKEFVIKHKGNKPISRISNEAITILTNYNWEGNIRELESTIKRAIALSNGDIITEKEIKLTPLRMNPKNNLSEKRRKEVVDSLILSILKDKIKNSITIENHRKELGNFIRICYHISSLILENENTPMVEKNSVIDKTGMNGSVMYKILRNCGFAEYDDIRSHLYNLVQEKIQSGSTPTNISTTQEEKALDAILLNDFYKLIKEEYDPLTFLNLICLKQFTLNELLKGNDPSESEVAQQIGINSGTLHNIRTNVYKCTWKEFKPKLLEEYNINHHLV